MADGVSLTRPGGRRAVGERAIRVALFLAAALSVLTTVLIVLSVVRETVNFLGDVAFAEFIFGTKWTPQLGGEDASFGVIPLVVGTVYLTVIALIVAIPLGLLSAIYLSEYASPRIRKLVKPVLEVLAGVPTIVFGFFALTFVTPEVLNGIFGLGAGTFNQLSAGLIIGVLILPTIASVAEDAMSAVPQSLREGAYGLGANRMRVSLRVVFPAALSGIVAALVLGASRAVGETLVVLLAAGSGQLLPQIVTNPLDSGGSMAGFIASTATGDAAQGSIAYETIFAVGALLFFMTLFLNIISIRLVHKFRQVYE